MSEALFRHDSRDAFEEEVTGRIARFLTETAEHSGEARAALSGGGTPRPVYERLSKMEAVPWHLVTLTLADERLAPPGDPASNAELVRATLLQNAGAAARFEPIEDGQTALPRQDLVLLGMGGDGHFASLFPTARELEAAMAADAPPVVKVTPDPLPENAPFPRLTMSLPAILAARKIMVLITGEEKAEVFRQAGKEGPVGDLPIRALLRSGHPDTTFHWAP